MKLSPMRTLTYVILAVVAAAAASLVLASPGGSHNAAPTEVAAPVATATAKPLPVVRYADFLVYDPVYIAVDKGFCGARGVDVHILGTDLGGPTAIQAVAAGAAEAGLSSIPAIINANAAGLPIVGVTDIQSALPDQALEHYFVRSDGGITKIEQLKGRKFAVNLYKSSFQYTAFMALGQHGLKDTDVTFVLLPFANQAQALDKGDVDVIGLIEPYASQARAIYGDKFRELFNAVDIFGTKQFTLHFLNRIWAADHPEQARAFVGCIVDAEAWIEAHEEDAKPIIAKYTKVDVQFVPEYHFQPGGMVVEKDVQFWLDYMTQRGDVTVKWLKASSVATNDFHP